LTEPASEPAAEPAIEPAADPAGGPAPGLFSFALVGRRAPALFVFGWLATIVGTAATVIGFVSGPSSAAALLTTIGLAVLSIGLLLLGGSQTIERAAARRPYPGPSPVLVFMAVVAISLFVAILVGVGLEAVGVAVAPAVGDLVVVGLQALVFVGVVRFMVIEPGAIRWADMGFRIGARRTAEALFTGALFAAPVLVVTAVVAAVVVSIAGVAPASPLPSTGTVSGLLLHLAAGAVIAPIGEEVLFRGFAVTAWARSSGPRAAIIRTAVLFAIAHVLTVGGDSFGQAASLAFVGAVGRLPVALALGWLYLRSRTIWAPIGLHAAFNAILIVGSEVAAGTLGL
jgi:membrane protease YdiL (CAAX protease family)